MNVLSFVQQLLCRSFLNAAHQLVFIGTIAFLGFPLLYLLWTILFPQPYENLYLRLLGSCLGLGLMLTPHWPSFLKSFMPFYWFIAVLYILPFFFTYHFLMNQASLTSSMSLLCSVFVLVLLVDLLSLSIFMILGWGLAFLCYFLTSPQIYLDEAHIEMVLMALLVVITSATFNYKTYIHQQQRMEGIAAAAGMIAHELRTPLLGIRTGSMALVRYLPVLFSAYKLAKEQGLLSSAIRESRLRQLETISDRIINEVDYANTIIDMLLVKAGQENSLQQCVLQPCSMADCLSEAMERYPFRSEARRALVHWHGDFQFMGSKLLMQHVLFNLLKNALYAIDSAQRGEITIWSASKDRFNYLYVKDTAKGIAAKQLPFLFEHFHTTKFMGTGIGLSFCRLVMRRFGGDITCKSEEGKHTTFTLSFPII